MKPRIPQKCPRHCSSQAWRNLYVYGKMIRRYSFRGGGKPPEIMFWVKPMESGRDWKPNPLVHQAGLEPRPPEVKREERTTTPTWLPYNYVCSSSAAVQRSTSSVYPLSMCGHVVGVYRPSNGTRGEQHSDAMFSMHRTGYGGRNVFFRVCCVLFSPFYEAKKTTHKKIFLCLRKNHKNKREIIFYTHGHIFYVARWEE